MFLTEPDFIIMSLPGRTTTPPINIGISTVKRMNARVRTLSRYSRLMISQTLRIGHPRRAVHSSAAVLACAHYVNKNFLEGGLHQFELADSCLLRRQPQERLRIGAGREFQFHLVPGVVE